MMSMDESSNTIQNSNQVFTSEIENESACVGEENDITAKKSVLNGDLKGRDLMKKSDLTSKECELEFLVSKLDLDNDCINEFTIQDFYKFAFKFYKGNSYIFLCLCLFFLS